MKGDGRGGARPGAGRPKKTTSQQLVDSMLATGKEWAKREGKSLDDLLLAIAYAKDDFEKVTIAQRIKAVSLFKQHTMASVSESHIDVTKHSGPGIYLPEELPEDVPANVTPIRKDA